MASDIRTAVGRWAAATSTGLQELTIGGLGWTPKAAKFTLVGATSSGIAADDFALGLGVVGPDGEGGYNEACLCGHSADAEANSVVTRRQRNDACVVGVAGSGPATFYATGAGDGSVANPGPIANGWRIDWTVAPPDAYFIVAQFFGGEDLQACAGTFQLAGSGIGINVEAVGFEASDLFLFSTGDETLPLTSSTFMRLMAGWARNDVGIPQASIVIAQGNNQATSATTTYVSPDSGLVKASVGTLNYKVTISAFDALGFSATPSAGATGEWVFFLALDRGDRQSWLGVIDAPTDDGSDWEVTAPGFAPQLVDLLAGNADAADSLETGGPDSEAFAAGAFTAEDAFCASGMIEDGAGTMNTLSFSGAQAMRTESGGGTLHDLGMPSLTGSGWSVPAVEIGTADATARKWIAWAIEEAAAATVTASLSLDSAVQKQRALAGSLAAALMARRSAEMQGDAALRALMTLAGELDAALRRALAAQAGLDGALASETAESAAADAALRRALSVDVDFSGALQAERSESAAIDALLTVPHGGSAALDAALAALRSGTPTLDAALMLLRDRDTSLDAALRRRRSTAGGLDAALTASRVVNASLQAALGKAMALTTALEVVVRHADLVLKSDLDGVLQTTKALSVSLQGVLRKAASLASGLNGTLQVAAEPLTGSLQAALTRTAALVATLSATVQLMRGLAVGLNAALQERAALATLLDAVVGTPPAAYAPRSTRGQAVEGRDRAIIGPDNRIILVPANPRRH